MIGTLRSATGRMALCDEHGCEEVAGVVVGPRHLCPACAWQDYRESRDAKVRRVAKFIARAPKEIR